MSHFRSRLKKGAKSFYKLLKRLNKKRRTLGTILIVSGVLLAVAPFAYKFILESSIDKSVQQEESEPIQPSQELLAGKFDSSRVPLRVIIPSVSIDNNIRGSKVIRGRWEVFDDSASFGIGSALPGEIGNAVIFAHARVGYFLPLRQVSTGDKVYVLTKGAWFSYEVKEIKEVLPTNVSVIAPTQDETLTLYTCSGFADSKRLIVVAKRV